MPLTTLERNPNKQANISSCVCCHLHAVRNSVKSRNGVNGRWRVKEGSVAPDALPLLCRQQMN